MEDKKKRRKISGREVATLRLIYQYRFVTAALVAASGLFSNRNNALRHLTRLTELGLIGVRYDKSYKLAGRPAAFYMLSPGIKVLRYAGEPLEPEAIHLLSKDKSASDRFERHCLDVLETATILNAEAGSDTKILSKAMLYAYDNVIHPLPDAFVSFGSRHFYLEFIDETTPAFAIKKRLRQYVEDYDENEWEENGSYFPPLILVTRTKTQLTKLRKTSFGALRQADTDLPVFGFSLEAHAERPGDIYVLPMGSYDDGTFLKML